MNPPRIVAEISSNHQRDLARCLAFVDAAADLGLWGVKFQQFKIRQLFAPEALAHDPRLLEREAWELPESYLPEIARHAQERGIAFGSTPFYLEAVDALAPHVDFLKIASYQLLFHPMLRAVARTGKPVVVATGMATLREVAEAMDVLRAAGCKPTLLHCVSAYPTPREEANLAAIGSLRNAFGGSVGWSDHTVDVDVVERAVRRHAAEMVELHLDLDGAGAEFAAGHCWLPRQIDELVGRLAIPRPLPLEDPADGDGRKTPRPIEAHERLWRSDPRDGLRPMRAVRAGLRGRRAG
jgi:N-acetylneuraminate synthase